MLTEGYASSMDFGVKRRNDSELIYFKCPAIKSVGFVFFVTGSICGLNAPEALRLIKGDSRQISLKYPEIQLGTRLFRLIHNGLSDAHTRACSKDIQMIDPVFAKGTKTQQFVLAGCADSHPHLTIDKNVIAKVDTILHWRVDIRQVRKRCPPYLPK